METPAPVAGSMDSLEVLASGRIPEHFPFKFDSASDPASPYSLILALFPEVESLPLQEFDTTQEIDLPETVSAYVREQCDLWGWKEEIIAKAGDEPTKSLFAKAWLRKTDETFRKLDSVSGLQGVDEAWLGGVVRVLQLWRKLDESSQLSLLQFEQQSKDLIFDELINLSPPGWTLRQKLDFLVLPYLRISDRIDLAQTWISGADDLEQVADAVFAPELASSLLQLCLSTQSREWRIVEHVISNIHPVQSTNSNEASSSSSGGTESSQNRESVNWDSLFEPTTATLQFFSDLIETAKTAKFPELTFQQLAEWTLGAADTQLDLLVRFLGEQKHFSRADLDVLRKTVFSKIPDRLFATEVIRAALEASRFMFLKSFINSEHSEILKSEVERMVEQFGTPGAPNLSLQHVLTTLELVDIGHDVTAKFERLQQLQSTFDIDPVFALNNPPMELVRYSLEHGSQVYLRFSQLQNVVAGKENGPKVAELCIEAALADDNFEAACELIDRKFVKEDSPGAWLALYEVGKFVSPQWDLPRSLPILQKQQQYLSRSISLCPEEDLVGVLRAWSALEHEHEEAEQTELGQSSAQTTGVTVPTTESSPDINDTRQVGARDQLSNLLVSGIGWAIGANQ